MPRSAKLNRPVRCQRRISCQNCTVFDSRASSRTSASRQRPWNSRSRHFAPQSCRVRGSTPTNDGGMSPVVGLRQKQGTPMSASNAPMLLVRQTSDLFDCTASAARADRAAEFWSGRFSSTTAGLMADWNQRDALGRVFCRTCRRLHGTSGSWRPRPQQRGVRTGVVSTDLSARTRGLPCR